MRQSPVPRRFHKLENKFIETEVEGKHLSRTLQLRGQSCRELDRERNGFEWKEKKG